MGLGAGQIALDTDLSALVTKTYQKPIGRALANINQSVPITTQTAILLQTEDYDTHGFHSTSVNTSRITPTIPGYYRFFGTAWFAGSTAVANQTVFRKNGVTNLAPAWRQTGDAIGTHSMGPIIVTQPMNGTTDYMELTAILGVALSTQTSIQFTCHVEWEFVRDL